MRLFKGNGGGLGGNGGGGHGHGGGRFNLHLGRGGAKTPRCDDSIGSAIDTKDQFDILIPVGHHRSLQPQALQNWRFVERTDTMVSSITTEEVRLPRPSKQQSVSRSSQSSWCCCSSATAPTTCADTENTLLMNSRAQRERETQHQQQEQVRQDVEAEPIPAVQTAWSLCAMMNNPPVETETGPPHSQAIYQAPSLRKKDFQQAELNRNNSLFDPLSEEEDGPEVPTGTGVGERTKKIRRKVRRALPWSRQRSFRGRQQMQQQQVQAKMQHE